MELNVTNIKSMNGAFYITDAAGNQMKADLGTVMMMLNIDRTNNLDDQIAAKLSEITERNTRIKELTEFMSALRTMKADGTNDSKKITVTKDVDLSTLTKNDSVTPGMVPEEGKSTTVNGCHHVIKIDGIVYNVPDDGFTYTYDKTTGKLTKTGEESIGVDLTINGQTKPIYGEGSWAEYFGIEWTAADGERPDNKDKKELWNQKFDANINNIKSQVDMLNNDSQMDNIKLQNLMEKRTNAFEMATKIMDTNNQTMGSIIRNL